MIEERLQAFSSTGKEQPWEEMKMHNTVLSAAYENVNPEKANRLIGCADRVCRVENLQTGEIKFMAWFCHVRLCPMCTWRRSLKLAKQMHQLVFSIEADKPHAYILLTLTQKNCEPDQLGDELTRVMQAFNLFTKYTEFKRAVVGYYRGVEVTHNSDTNTFHPHIHAILCVDSKYFKSKNFIHHERWVNLWQQALKADYRPSVHVKRIYNDNMSSAIAETAKYAVKASDYLMPHDWDLTVDLVRILDVALHNRRFVTFGGIFKDYRKRLQLDDPDKGELSDAIPDDVPVENIRIVHYLWDACKSGYWRE